MHRGVSYCEFSEVTGPAHCSLLAPCGFPLLNVPYSNKDPGRWEWDISGDGGPVSEFRLGPLGVPGGISSPMSWNRPPWGAPCDPTTFSEMCSARVYREHGCLWPCQWEAV